MVVKEEGASKEHSTPKACYRRSDTTHLANHCPFKTAICHQCNKKGHITRACRTKSKGKKALTQHTHTTEEKGEVSESYELFTLSQRQNAPITVSLRVNQVEMTMEVDTGVSVYCE